MSGWMEIDKIPQAELPELRAAIKEVMEGGDPLNFVNCFFRYPIEAPDFPRVYWEKRICAVAEMMSELGKSKKN